MGIDQSHTPFAIESEHMRIAILGSPSSGKTTLIKGLAKILGEDTIIIDDYARKFISDNNNKHLTIEQQIQLCNHSKSMEKLYSTITQYNDKRKLISDLSGIITAFYAIKLLNRPEFNNRKRFWFDIIKHEMDDLVFSSKMFYSKIMHCEPLNDQIEETGRQFSSPEMVDINKEMKDFYDLYNIDPVMLPNCSIEERLKIAGAYVHICG